MLQLIFRRFLRELDKAPGGNNLQYILKCPCIPFFGNQGLHNEIMLGGNGGHSGVMCEGFPYRDGVASTFRCWLCLGRCLRATTSGKQNSWRAGYDRGG